MKKTVLLLAALALGGAALAQPKVFQGPDPDATPKMGGDFRVNSISDPKTFNPFVAKETSSTNVIDLFLPSLTGYNPYTIEPDGMLAESFEVKNNGLTIVFRLRKDAKWSDGTPITADDVIFSAQVHADEEVNSNSRSSFFIDGSPVIWTKIDDYTVQADFPKPFAPALLQGWSIVPKHIFEPAYKEGRVTELWDVGTDPSEIVSGGPFMLEQFVPGERIVLKRNPNYWGVDPEGRAVPYLDRYIFTVVPDLNASLAKFLAGETDIYTASDADQVAQIIERIDSGRLDAEIFPNADVNFGTNFIFFNWNNEDPWKAQLFRNKKFRQAMAHLMDKESMIELALGGLGQPQWSPISIPAKQFFTDDVPKFEFNPERAAELLAEIGFRTKNEDGWLVDASGRVLEFTLFTNQGNNVREKIAQIFAEDARAIGVKVNFTPIDFNELVRKILNTRDFDAILVGLTDGIEPAFSRNVWELDGALHMWNYGPEFESFEILIDKLMKQGATTLDQEKRREIYVQFQKVVAENLPLIYTVAGAYNPARLKRLGGVFGEEDLNSFVGQFPYIETVFIDQ
ncbi:ABC transporter substrate-binding protein [Marinithermus hydrothermalis]|uniref:ABC-type transporter, periplasmic subunit n=1 Tax=Marinithermus hydrothermalis (strain DSM 14884 / JCM 11576 / T1) TaxID=869210 RepID=F2NQT4_MARHT|nr:ABC transporter substrate-binding protein [Marinithermus hydrothermalis]AEB12298.1 ABC-type transporter, periplasmic subunit [Marinithermus hydrothermalis DSM 14884]